MSSLKHLATGGSCPQGKLPCLQEAPARKQVQSMVFKTHDKLQLIYRLIYTGIWQWRKWEWSAETRAWESAWVSYELSHQAQLTNLGCILCLPCCILCLSCFEHGGRGEGVSQLFLRRQTAGSTAEDSCMGKHC